MPRIHLSNGGYALVDEEDLELVRDPRFRWRRTADGYIVSGSNKAPVYMHRLIANTPAGMDTDHANARRHDNRRDNIRPANRSLNNAGARRKLSRVGFRGVQVERRRFRARIRVGGKLQSLGYFDTAAAAARAYDEAARQHFGPFARLNFPRRGERRAMSKLGSPTHRPSSGRRSRRAPRRRVG